MSRPVISVSAGEFGHIGTCRWSMEDETVVDHAHDTFGVLDGHGGRMLAKLAAERIVEAMKGKTHCPTLLAEGFGDLDTQLYEHPKFDGSGTCVCMVHVDLDTQELRCINLGDCRAVVGSGEKAIPISVDHKPDDPKETARIEELGGRVYFGRVEGELAVSRALGDFRFKKNNVLLVSNKPDLVRHPIGDDDEFVIVACDGLWDVMTNEAAVAEVHKLLASSPISEIADANEKCKEIARALVLRAINTSTDNVSVVIILLNRETATD